MAGDNMKIQVLGLGEAKKNLATLSTKLQNTIVRASARAGANVFLKASRASTYGAGRQQRTGLMQRSQSVATRKKGDTIFGGVKMRRVSVGGASAFATAVRKTRKTVKTKAGKVKASGFYFKFFERGTVRMKARPWVLATAESTSPAALDAFKTKLRADLDGAANQLPKGVPRT